MLITAEARLRHCHRQESCSSYLDSSPCFPEGCSWVLWSHLRQHQRLSQHLRTQHTKSRRHIMWILGLFKHIILSLLVKNNGIKSGRFLVVLTVLLTFTLKDALPECLVLNRGSECLFSLLLKNQNPLSPYEMHVNLLFGELDHSVQSILNRELWSTVD